MSTPPKTKRVGRPPNKGGALQDRFIGFAPKVNTQLERLAEQEGISVPEWVRRAVDDKLNAPAVVTAESGTDSFTAPYLSRVPCGPWQEAIDTAGSVNLSKDVADELEVREGDVFVRADGESMEGAGIMDGMLVQVRPLGSRSIRRREIAVIQVTTSDGQCYGTIKHWDGLSGELPRLKDGQGNDFPLPSDLERVDVIGRVTGVLGRL